MSNLIENINAILSDWNPIDIDSNMATDEYRCYIPLILRSLKDENSLFICLSEILVNRIGLEYNSENPEHFASVRDVCHKIMALQTQLGAGQ